MTLRDRFTKLLTGARAAAEKLTPRQKRRLRRGTIVAAIAAGGVLGLDFVATGGPDWNPIGADAPRFELVASAAAAEHPLLPRSIAYEPAPELPEMALAEPAMFTYDPNVSADDLLGAPVYAEINTEIDLSALIVSLQPQAASLSPIDALLKQGAFR